MKLMDKWNDYWFREGSLFDLAVVRLILVGFQLFWLATVIPGHMNIAALQPDLLYKPLTILQFLTVWTGGGRPSVELMDAIYWLAIVSGLLAFVGLKARVGLVLFAATNIFLQAYIYSFHDKHHQEGLMMIMLMAVALSPSARVLSLDSWLAARRQGGQTTADMIFDAKDTFARWPILLGHWMFSLFYLSAFYSKVSRSGFDWANGFTLQYFLARDGIKYDLPLGVWLSQQHELALALQWLVLFFQATFFLILIRPWLKWIYVPAGMTFHVAILFTMGASFQMWIASYCVFIPWALVARRLMTSSGGLSTPAVVPR